MTGGETSLLHGSGSKGGEPDHITYRIDIGSVCLILCIHFQESALICLQTRRLDIEGTCRAGPPDAVERHLSNDLFAADEVDLHAVAVFVGNGFDTVHLFSEAQDGALLVKVVGERVDDFRVDEGEQAAALVDDGHAHPKGGKDAGIFQTDHARAYNRQRARQVVELEQIVADKDPFPIKRDVVAFCGACSRGNDHVCRTDVAPAASIHILQSDSIRIDERGFPRDKFDAVALELMADNIELMLDDMVRAIK